MTLVFWISIVGVFVTIPHVAEDFVYGVPQKYGVSLTAAGVLVSAGYFVQMLGMMFLSKGKKAGLYLSFLIGSTGLAGALWDHLSDLMKGGHYREGPISKVWVAGIIVWSGLLAAASFQTLRYSRRR